MRDRLRLFSLISKASAISVAGVFLCVGAAILMEGGTGRAALWIALAPFIAGIACSTWWLGRALRRSFNPSEARAMTKAFAGFSPLWMLASLFVAEFGGGALGYLGPPVFGFIGAVLAMILSLATLSSLTAAFALWITRQEETLFPER